MTVPFLIVWAMFFLAPVSLSLSHAVTSPGVEVRLLARITPHDGDRALCFRLTRDELEDFLSCESLDGVHSRASYWRFVNGRRPLPSGAYLATATLTRIVDGRRRDYAASQPLTVIGPE